MIVSMIVMVAMWIHFTHVVSMKVFDGAVMMIPVWPIAVIWKVSAIAVAWVEVMVNVAPEVFVSVEPRPRADE
jgi:hypothetical protein